MESPKPLMARFRARGKIFTVPMEVLMNYPDSYLTWVARSHPGPVACGTPIEINKRPDVIQRLLKTYQGMPLSGNKTCAQEALYPEKSDSDLDRRSAVDSVRPSEVPSSEYNSAIEGAIRDTLRVLQQIKRWGHMHDKALFVYRWGRSANDNQILRPHTVKLYESLTGKLHDIRTSQDVVSASSTSSDFLSVTSLESAAFISPFIQSTIIKRIRDSGFSCSFVDIFVDRNGQLVWRGHQVRCAPQHASTGSIRCLMVNT